MRSLTAVGQLAPHLTDENHVQILETALHRTKREVKPPSSKRFKRPLTTSGATPDKLRQFQDLRRGGGGYSARSSDTGSTRAARWAGISDASTTSASSPAPAHPNVNASSGCTS